MSDKGSKGLFSRMGASETWDEVPRTSEQVLVDMQRAFEALQEECSENATIESESIERMQKMWKEIDSLQEELSDYILQSDTRISALKLDEVRAVERSERAACNVMEEEARELEARTAQLLRTKDHIDDEAFKLAPYKEFLDQVAKANLKIYPRGGDSVMEHFERLQGVQRELQGRMTKVLQDAETLRTGEMEFTSTALAQLDVQQARNMSLREQLDSEIRQLDEWSKKLQNLQTANEKDSAIQIHVKGALQAMYEQLWRRYHPAPSVSSSTTAMVSPPQKDIEGQAAYIQLVMTALAKLADYREKEETTASLAQSLQNLRSS